MDWFLNKVGAEKYSVRVFSDSQRTTYLYIIQRPETLEIDELKRFLLSRVPPEGYIKIVGVNGTLRVVIHVPTKYQTRLVSTLDRFS